jgi:hypothetical protein
MAELLLSMDLNPDAGRGVTAISLISKWLPS